MSSIVQALARRGVITPPRFVVSNLQFESLMGSHAYGVATDVSDMDIYGWCIPPKEILFPHLAGVIPGFGDQGQRFEQYQQPHVEADGRDYDLTIYNIVKYFKLCADCNPNMIDSLFVPENCVKHATLVGQKVRENRRLFLSKRVWPRFKGYAYEQVKKLSNKQPVGKRLAVVQEHGYDVKFAYHVVRLLSEAEMILNEGDLDLQRNNDELKAIRRGEWAEARVHAHFDTKVAALEEAYGRCHLPDRPDEVALKRLLLECLEDHYGNLDACVTQPDEYRSALFAIGEVIDRFRRTEGHEHPDGGHRDAEEAVPERDGPSSGVSTDDDQGVSDAGPQDDRPVCPEKLEDAATQI